MEGTHLNEALDVAGKLIVSRFKAAAKEDGFSASGELDKSVRYTVDPNELKLFAKEYAGALSEGISTGGSGKKEEFKKLQSNIIKWAKIKGMRPQIRDKKGRFTKVTDRAWRSLGYVLARSIRQRGISERFGYKGSGFIKQVQKSIKKELTDIITKGYEKDLQEQLNK